MGLLDTKSILCHNDPHSFEIIIVLFINIPFFSLAKMETTSDAFSQFQKSWERWP